MTRVPHFSRPLREVGPFISAHAVIAQFAERPMRGQPRRLTPCSSVSPVLKTLGLMFSGTTRMWRQPPRLSAERSEPTLYFLQNLPTPTRTCTVFIPGFGVASPAFETCKYRNSTLQLYFAPNTCVPSAAPEVKFTVFVLVGTL